LLTLPLRDLVGDDGKLLGDGRSHHLVVEVRDSHLLHLAVLAAEGHEVLQRMQVAYVHSVSPVKL